jgi:type IX secretion system PorP/SprF family membrane protein
MKKIIRFKLVLFVLVLLAGLNTTILLSQDLHYTQFYASPQNTNPAQTGLFDGDWRFVGNYRTQWAGISVPFISNSIAADTRLKTQLQNGTPALGLLVNNDKSGDSKLSVTQVMLSAAFIKKLDEDSTHFISFAVQPGFTTKSFNANALTFDKQYDGDNYNSSLASGENFTSNRISYFDGGAGLSYLWKKSDRKQLNIGVSSFHLNTPKQSFFNNGKSKLDIKTIISATATFPITQKIDLVPLFFYQKQGKAQEALIGAMGKYHLKPMGGYSTAVSIGTLFRTKDACNIVASMDYMNFTAGISYDINLSQLKEASNSRGGFEISLIYIFKKYTPFVAKHRVCPVYM